MGLSKCPKCELNYIRDGEKYCNVCRRGMKGEKDAEEMHSMCIECGENVAIGSHELCAECLRERRRQEKLQRLMEHTVSEDLTLEGADQLDEIDVPMSEDIPSEELQEIDKEFGDPDESNEFEDDIVH